MEGIEIMVRRQDEYREHGARNGGVENARLVLLVGEAGAAQALLEGVDGIRIERCGNWFDAISVLNQRSFDAVLAPVRAIERRPEVAVRHLREAAGKARLVLLSEPANEILSRRLVGSASGVVGTLGEGSACDEYVIWPATSLELAAALTATTPSAAPFAPPIAAQIHGGAQHVAAKVSAIESKVVPTPSPAAQPRRDEPERPATTNGSHGSASLHGYAGSNGGSGSNGGGAVHGAKSTSASSASAGTKFSLTGLAVAEVVLEALVREPHDAAKAAVRELNSRLPPSVRLGLLKATDGEPHVPGHMVAFSRVLPRVGATGITAGSLGASAEPPRVLHLMMDRSYDERAGQELMEQIAPQLARVMELQDRHSRLQRLAITDDLTGLYNGRYFKHFLERILVRAKESRFPVTVLMFDIDHFKKYNDEFGHAAGDEILQQVGKMMKRCVREHDLVARLGGDEFAVIFWEKDGPRQAISGKPIGSGRPPKSPQLMFDRFKQMIAHHDFQALGPGARGNLTISGGLAVYPYDARTAEELVEAADRALMFGAKKGGRNMLHIVGPENQRDPSARE